MPYVRKYRKYTYRRPVTTYGRRKLSYRRMPKRVYGKKKIYRRR